MYRFIGEQDAYSFFNMMAYYAIMVSSLFFFKSKRKTMGLGSRYITHFVSRLNRKLSTVVEFVFASIESVLFALVLDVSATVNRPFGELLDTGTNYFGILIVVPILWSLLSTLLVVNPLKQIDIAVMLAPIQLFFFKTACFFNGCCWGIEWEYGLYNHHYHHPGKQVPVQAIEMFLALAIFIFLLWYRKKAKPGRLFPMYIILYSATRFPVEFLSAVHKSVIGPFNTYHILCVVGVVIGLLMLLIISRFGEKISALFEKPHAKLDARIAEFENAHQAEWEKQARDKARKKEEKRKFKEREKKNKKMYAHSRKL